MTFKERHLIEEAKESLWQRAQIKPGETLADTYTKENMLKGGAKTATMLLGMGSIGAGLQAAADPNLDFGEAMLQRVTGPGDGSIRDTIAWKHTLPLGTAEGALIAPGLMYYAHKAKEKAKSLRA